MSEDALISRSNDPNLPFSVFNGDEYQFPVLISVPHAGRRYPEEIHDNLAVPPASLIRLEDRYADRLAAGAIKAGFTTLVAQQPRAWIDLNRGHREIDPDMVTGIERSQLPAPSRKVRGGLGLVPRRLSGTGDLWRRKWSYADVQERVRHSHAPYHQSISHILEKMCEKYGSAILLDLHSMPPLIDEKLGDVDIVIGDRFGRSSGSRYAELSLSFCNQSGLRGQLNHPYAGGYILERHGAPDKDIHALQLEIDRRCYLDENLREPGTNMTEMANHVERLAGLLADQILDRFQLAAAE